MGYLITTVIIICGFVICVELLNLNGLSQLPVSTLLVSLQRFMIGLMNLCS